MRTENNSAPGTLHADGVAATDADGFLIIDDDDDVEAIIDATKNAAANEEFLLMGFESTNRIELRMSETAERSTIALMSSSMSLRVAWLLQNQLTSASNRLVDMQCALRAQTKVSRLREEQDKMRKATWCGI